MRSVIRQRRRQPPDSPPVVVGFGASTLVRQPVATRANLHRQLFEKVPYPRFVCATGSLAIEEINAAAVRQFGYSRAEFSQMKLPELCAPADLPRLREFCSQPGHSHRAGDPPVFRFRKKTGAWREVQMDCSRIALRERRLILLLAQDVTEKRRIQQRLLAQQTVSRALSESSTLAEASPRIFDALCEQFGCDWGEVWQVDPIADALRCLEIWHPAGPALTEMEQTTRRRLFVRGEGIPGTVWARNKLLWITDVLDYPEYQHAAATARYGMRSAFAFPIQLNAEVLGVITVFRREPSRPDKHLLGLLREISQQVGQVMGRRRAERQLLKISEQEQQHIGQELHDGLCQQLVGLAYLANDLEVKLAKRSRPEAAGAARIAQLGRDAAVQARQVARGLNPVNLGRMGLQAALGELTANIAGLFSIRCRFVCPRHVSLPEHETALHLYRIAQEAIHNAITHGHAHAIEVALTRTAGTLILRVNDNGRGLPNGELTADGMGCANMRYRAGAIGGRLEFTRPPRGGCVVTCALPTRKGRRL